MFFTIKKPEKKKHKKANCCVFCSRYIGKHHQLRVDGQKLKSRFCYHCYCKVGVNGWTCLSPRRHPGHPWCSVHLKCTVPGCLQEVENKNPEDFKFCPGHTCAAPDCAARRVEDGEGAKFCADHVCSTAGCNDARQPGGHSSYCAKHTCEERHCRNDVSGEGDAGDPLRRCLRHRPCKFAGGCVRLCHMYDNGDLSPYCGDHRCHWAAALCEKERVWGSYCPDHTCRREDCFGGLTVQGGGYCADDECRRENCRYERYRDRVVGFTSDWCHYHKCRDRDCEREGEGPGLWCPRHQPCRVSDCRRPRVMDGERVTLLCAHHTTPTCGWSQPPCDRQVVPDGQFCRPHTCETPQCLESKDPYTIASHACQTHKCTVDRCGLQRMYAAPHEIPGNHTFCRIHACQAAGRRCANQVLEGGRFCRRHKCRVADCEDDGSPARRGLCEEHAVPGYRLAGADPRLRGLGYDPRVVVDPGYAVGGDPRLDGLAYDPVPRVVNLPVRGGWRAPEQRVYDMGPGRRRFEFYG